MVNTPQWHLHYDEGVPQAVEIPDLPLYSILRESARRFPNNTAVRTVFRYLTKGIRIGGTLTYRELDEVTDRFATALHALGIRQHDRVVIMLPNLPQYSIAFFGILKAGGIVVNTNPTYTPRELQQQLQDSGAETIITLTGLYEKVESIRAQTSIKRVILTDIVDSLPWYWQLVAARQVRATGMMVKVPPALHIHDFYTLIRRHAPEPPAIPYEPDDVQVLQYTGGTTGVPKGAMLTHRSLMSNAAQVQVWLSGIEQGKEKVLGALPFFHIYGLTVSILVSTKIAAESVMVPNPRDVDLILQIIDHERISFYPAVPAMYSMLINHPRVQDFNLHSVRACISAGAPLPDEVARRFEELTRGHLVEAFGMTECSPAVIVNPLLGKRRTGAIGVPISNTSVELVALEPDEDGNYPPVAPGERGELVVYGPQVMKGYWNKPDETAQIINSRGGLHTGDIARMDEDGFFYIVDRKKDLIITSGYNVVPREVEEVLYMHPAVIEACVVGVPNAQRGEVVKAFVVLKPGEEVTVAEIRDFCKEYLTQYKVPKFVEFRSELPKSQIGKVLRRLLVEEEAAKQKSKEARVAGRLQARQAKVQVEVD